MGLSLASPEHPARPLLRQLPTPGATGVQGSAPGATAFAVSPLRHSDAHSEESTRRAAPPGPPVLSPHYDPRPFHLSTLVSLQGTRATTRRRAGTLHCTGASRATVVFLTGSSAWSSRMAYTMHRPSSVLRPPSSRSAVMAVSIVPLRFSHPPIPTHCPYLVPPHLVTCLVCRRHRLQNAHTFLASSCSDAPWSLESDWTTLPSSDGNGYVFVFRNSAGSFQRVAFPPLPSLGVSDVIRGMGNGRCTRKRSRLSPRITRALTST